jgi:hypothetical protein
MTFNYSAVSLLFARFSHYLFINFFLVIFRLCRQSFVYMYIHIYTHLFDNCCSNTESYSFFTRAKLIFFCWSARGTSSPLFLLLLGGIECRMREEEKNIFFTLLVPNKKGFQKIYKHRLREVNRTCCSCATTNYVCVCGGNISMIYL